MSGAFQVIPHSLNSRDFVRKEVKIRRTNTEKGRKYWRNLHLRYIFFEGESRKSPLPARTRT
jgi:hypothetical protein